ncbi:putative acylneuraminate cytidylyltransferase [Magnetofaba australis IT-1]|uniref:Putative acylneuraminate cytidylyltransferase n=1 Tax=Magnetofaba australis IT-1 TaxID=1434232 RepID=A0A1Y2JYX9_9PROT|nr:putative acylneuraminate cytidylyltransferase [Magnetofaba australis IT-1]
MGTLAELKLTVSIACNDPVMSAAAAALGDDLTLPERHAEDLHAALAENLLANEAQTGAQYAWVCTVEPLHPFRPLAIPEAAFEILRDNPGLESVACAEPLRGRIWAGDGAHETIADSFNRDHPLSQKPYRELVGLFTLTRRDVLLGGHRIGEEVGLIAVPNHWTRVETRDATSLEAARLLAPMYQNKTP